jgi:hypothetical protein
MKLYLHFPYSFTGWCLIMNTGNLTNNFLHSRRVLLSGIQRSVVHSQSTYVSEEHVIPNFRVEE